MLEKFDTSNIISQIIKLKSQFNISYIDACIMFAEKNNLEIESVADVVKKNVHIRDSLQIEAEDLNIVKKSARLPL